MSEKLYGLDHQEYLDSSLDEIMERLFGEHTERSGEGDEVVIGRMEFPFKVYVYERQKVGDVDYLATQILEDTMEYLDGNHRLAADFPHDQTDKMKEAAKAFAEVMAKEYVPYDCERTGETIMITEEMMRKETE